MKIFAVLKILKFDKPIQVKIVIIFKYNINKNPVESNGEQVVAGGLQRHGADGALVGPKDVRTGPRLDAPHAGRPVHGAAEHQLLRRMERHRRHLLRVA